MEIIPYTDPTPGRCRNYRDGQRCNDYDGTEHVCWFPPKPPTSTSGGWITSTNPQPTPWVRPFRARDVDDFKGAPYEAHRDR